MMRITEEIKIFFGELSGWQRIKIGAVIAIVLVLMLSGWLDSCSSMREVKRLEREATAAKREAAEHLERAARIAEKLRVKEEELNKLEEIADEKLKELESAGRDTRDARDAYNRAVRDPRTDDPDADALCGELAALGYPCR